MAPSSTSKKKLNTVVKNSQNCRKWDNLHGIVYGFCNDSKNDIHHLQSFCRCLTPNDFQFETYQYYRDYPIDVYMFFTRHKTDQNHRLAFNRTSPFYNCYQFYFNFSLVVRKSFSLEVGSERAINLYTFLFLYSLVPKYLNTFYYYPVKCCRRYLKNFPWFSLYP